MDKGKIGIGIIGTGFGATVQLPAFKQMSDVEVIGIAAKTGSPTARELIENPRVHLISIATPPIAHEELTRACIKAGKAVLCEKPFTLSAAHAKEMADLAEKNGVMHAIDFEFRYLPAFLIAKKMIDEGALGSIRTIDVRWHAGGWSNPDRPWSWQLDKDVGGGILGALGVHTFDYLEWLVAPIRSVTCETGIGIPTRKDEAGTSRTVTAEDHATMTMNLEGGIAGTFSLSNIDPKASGHRIEIHGETSLLIESTCRSDYAKGFSVSEFSGGRWKPVYADPDPESIKHDGRIIPFRALAEDMVKSLRDKTPYHGPTFRDGWRTQLIRESALASAGSGTSVDIPEAVS